MEQCANKHSTGNKIYYKLPAGFYQIFHEIIISMRSLKNPKNRKGTVRHSATAGIFSKIHGICAKILLSRNCHSRASTLLQLGSSSPLSTLDAGERRGKARKGEETLRSLEWNHAGPRLHSQRYIFRGEDEKKGIRPLTFPADTSSVTPPEIRREKERERKGERIPLVISETIFRRGIWPYRDNVLVSWDFIWTCRIVVARESLVTPIALTRQIEFVLKTALRRKMCLRIRASLPREGGWHVERIPSTSTISHGPNYVECCRLSLRRNSHNSLREIADSSELRFWLSSCSSSLLYAYYFINCHRWHATKILSGVQCHSLQFRHPC